MEGNGTVYLPTDTKAFVRPVLTKEEVDALIASIPHIEQKKCDSENPHLLAAYYRTFLQSHQCESLIQLMKTAYAQTEDQEKSGRKPLSARNSRHRRGRNDGQSGGFIQKGFDAKDGNPFPRPASRKA